MSARTILNPPVSLTSGNNLDTITVGTITGTINSTAAISCAGGANYGTSSVSGGTLEGNLVFCRNISGGNDELDIVAVNAYPGIGLTNPILNIYTSQTTLDGADVAGGSYKDPLVSLTTAQVNINGSLAVTTIIDSTGSSGTAGQYLQANGTGGWAWTTP